MKPLTLLVPIDFSDFSLKAMDVALRLRRGHPEMKLVLLHVVLPTSAQMEAAGVMSLTWQALDDQKAAALSRLTEIAARFSYGFDQEIDLKVEIGYVAATICETAERVSADMIVLSSHGRSGLTRLLMGSVAEEVVRHAECPVIVVPKAVIEKSIDPGAAA